MTTKDAMKQLTKQLKKDSDYRRSWKDNIAMAFKDKYYWHKKHTKRKYMNSEDIHVIANEAAENFLKLLCDEIKYPKGR